MYSQRFEMYTPEVTSSYIIEEMRVLIGFAKVSLIRCLPKQVSGLATSDVLCISFRQCFTTVGFILGCVPTLLGRVFRYSSSLTP